MAMNTVAHILSRARAKGVRLWAEDGRLRYEAPKGALTQEELERLRVHRGQIVSLLERTAAAEVFSPGPEHRLRCDRAPLAFSQLAHWNLYRLSERRLGRYVSSATRINGPLDIPMLRASVKEIVRRHDALRTQIIGIEGVPTQLIDESSDAVLEIRDLTPLSESLRETETAQLIASHPLEPIDVAVDPLLSVRLLKLRESEHVLLMAMEHMISDGRSMSILLQEVFAAYAQAIRGLPFCLPAVPIQFSDYAAWQRSIHLPSIEKRIVHWHARMASCPRSSFPTAESVRPASRPGLGLVRFEIDRNLKAELREWCRVKRTTLVMSACTAYAALLLRWCNVSDTVIRYQTDGRFSSRTENTIGYLAFPLYMRVQLADDDSFLDLLNRVTQEYCRAYEHADFSYLEAQVPRPEFTRTSRFNWLPQSERADYLDVDGLPDSITCTRVYSKRSIVEGFTIDDDPSIGLLETDDEVRGSVAFPLHRFSTNTMEKFARNFLVMVMALAQKPEVRVRDVRLA